MPHYAAPLEDLRFVLHELIGTAGLADLPGYEDATPDLIDQVLGEAARLCEQTLFPLNHSGDREGCRFENGVVTTPAGFREAYRTFAEGGWTGLACDPEFGGQGLPQMVNLALTELLCSANLSFATYPGLSHGAYNALHTHGNDVLKRRFLPKLVDGTWSGTMCLTEPQCGTDLGLVRTRAEPTGDADAAGPIYRITGTKIFISAGEHDLTENIVHLVLARLPDAPAGIRGISLFVVPKFLPDDAGRPGLRNGVACGAIEHKMGIRASATCVMNFDGAAGWLVGTPHKGMRAMFTMMNEARLGVGIQGVALAEVAYQNARAYAAERLQGRAPAGALAPDRPADPILVHPDIRATLLGVKAFVEGARGLACWIGHALDVEARHPDPVARAEAGDLVALLTPVVKAFFTDGGFEATSRCLQVFGGHGYIVETGMEQFLRDARIAPIYEGANGIQALDLVGRKLPMATGRLLRRFFHPAARDLEGWSADPALAELAAPFAKAFGRLQQVSVLIARRGLADPDEAAAAASDYLRLFALVALGYMWLRMAAVARARLADGAGERAGFYRAKCATARFYMAKVLPQVHALAAAIAAGAAPVMEPADEMI